MDIVNRCEDENGVDIKVSLINNMNSMLFYDHHKNREIKPFLIRTFFVILRCASELISNDCNNNITIIIYISFHSKTSIIIIDVQHLHEDDINSVHPPSQQHIRGGVLNGMAYVV